MLEKEREKKVSEIKRSNIKLRNKNKKETYPQHSTAKWKNKI